MGMVPVKGWQGGRGGRLTFHLSNLAMDLEVDQEHKEKVDATGTRELVETWRKQLGSSRRGEVREQANQTNGSPSLREGTSKERFGME